MLFSSSIFLFLFLPVVIIGYRLVPKGGRIYFLMAASLFFYAWGEPKYILVMLLSIAVNYSFGRLIHGSAGSTSSAGKARAPGRLLLFTAVACNLLILFYFKYMDFVLDSSNRLFGTAFPYHDIVMPIGISFFTFQGMSYVIDLYLKKVRVQRNPALTAFYISFFPQLIAGPIVRYNHIEAQLYERDDSFDKFVAGAKRFIIGLSKKVIIANTVGYVADQVFSGPAIENTAATAWLGIICYTFQIFFDFSGYSDMAIGLGKMFGFDFLENFNLPYISKTITEFWRRWHISLSSWFRDYVYIPLGGNRRGNVYINLLIVFLVTGFWHGASFNFIVWGLWHGLFLVIERTLGLREAKKGAFVPFRHALTLLIVVIGWVFFRAEGLREAASYLGIMFGAVQPENVGFTVSYYISNKAVIALVIAIIASMPVAKTKLFETISSGAAWKYASPALLLALFFVSIVFVVSSSYNPFIYFRF
ncbi:MAG: MBOAT family protein [Clostridiales bacterium]|nr:MBOAT family protein [Clostridiales bacterium]